MLDQRKQEPPIDLLDALRRASAVSSKGLLAQVLEIFRLSRGAGGLTPQEYFYFRLYDDSKYTAEEKRRFLGKIRQSQVFQKCLTVDHWERAHEKVLFDRLMREAGVPVPQIAAVYDEERSADGAAALRTDDDLSDFVRSEGAAPFFGKPATGMFSVGTCSVKAYDAGPDELVFWSGERESVSAFVDEVRPFRAGGYLLQKPLQPHADVRTVCGDRIATLRLVVLIRSSGPELFRGLWKIPVGENISDNFWRPGNILAALDLESGVVTRAVQGIGPYQVVLESHPDTGVTLPGYRLPMWEETLDTCMRAARALSDIEMLAFDIAVCPEGPVVVEANVGGDFNLPQLVDEVGLKDEQFESWMRDRGCLG
jgi:hypothetical protein